MTAPYDRRSDVFTDWLDAQVTGKSTPDHELAADADLADLCAAADQFHGLAERLGQDATRVSPSTRSWEDIMAATPAGLSPGSSISTDRAPASTRWDRSSMRSRFDRFTTGALAAALVVAIGGGAWLAAERTPFGGGDQPPTMSIGGFLPEVTVEPGANMSVIPYPQADCQATRPSRSWVLAHIEDGRGGYVSVSDFYEVPIHATQLEQDAMLRTFSQWQACQTSDVPIAYSFAFETPRYTFKDGFFSVLVDGRPDDDELQRLASKALSWSPWSTEPIGSEEIPATPMSTPIMYGQLPIPAGATPISDQAQFGVGFWPVVFGEEIRVVAPGRAEAWVYWVNPETMEVRIGGSEAVRVVFTLVDGEWLIDGYGSAAMG